MILEIKKEEISELNDSDLRSLIAMLCEAEVQSKGLSSVGVTWGGHQNAPDGGIDVKVEYTIAFDEDGYIPRNHTGFQVKKPKMPAAEISKEMCPNNKLRAVIIELTQSNGAYIIVSSNSLVSDKALAERRKAMREALSDLPQHNKLKIDFYDSQRVASWVNSFPAIVLWVKKKLGRPIQGWLPFGNWSNPKSDLEEDYLVDDGLRLYDTSNPAQDRLFLIDGINNFRLKFHQASTVLRLVGLSGVGKTRLVQALFDARIGNKALNRSKVCYTDVGFDPIPNPINFAQQLMAWSNNGTCILAKEVLEQ